MLYYGVVEIDHDKTASGYFPGITGCIFAGDNMREAMQDAESALNAHFELMAEKGLTIPGENDMPDIDSGDYGESGLKVMMICVDIDITKYLGKSERINITMPHLLIEKIDRAVGQDSRYTSRSHFIAEAARKELSHR
ncbi:type II toxin-antitoxin system HicB family antitoxin [Pantoea sp. YU22]|uniref:type II toxin-antitoxin system HicB family antitoxin n=1 Tax=Pantoea sp. YU22 TaxID=2497684 RepID=UPI000F89A57E|nr:type II toxin-antitoxin system HicB family antitoxin [Pantoea sp. YU22]RTY57978.1 type II toxin-antitoxin system HicB family antitoxin [Pantoea sp. YU22]